MRNTLATCAGLAIALASSLASATPCPNVMFVLNSSGSMTSAPDGSFVQMGQGKSKWELQAAAVKAVLAKYGDSLPFGLEMFTSSGFGGNSCYADTMINVEPDHGTSAMINNAIGTSMPDGGTNTGEAIKRAYSDPAMQDKSRGQYIILITDGDPNCDPGDGTNAGYTVGEIANALKLGIKTFVVGFDGTNGVNPANLNLMANAGGEPRNKGTCGAANNPCYFSASNATKLNDALSQIIDVVTTGEFGMMTCDDSCYANGCPNVGGETQICTTDELNMKPHCAPDPCNNKDCGAGEYCRRGSCVKACTSPCPTGQKCFDGACIGDPCYQVTCGSASQICDPLSGNCIQDPCAAVKCAPPTACNASTGRCEDSACNFIKCPDGYACQPDGNCVATSAADGGTATVFADGGGNSGKHGAGCDVGAASRYGQDGALWASLMGGLGALVMLGRRRRRG